MRALDSPATDRHAPQPPHEQKLLEQYFYDLYGVFMKKLSDFVLAPEAVDFETVKLQAMLQELIKVKKLMGRGNVRETA